MQYHALALAVNEGDVDLVGLEGAPVHAALTAESRLHTHRLPDRAFRSRAAGGRRRYRLDVGGTRRDAGGALADDAAAAAKARRHSRAKPARRADACVSLAGRSVARRALRHRLAQPVARHPRRAAGRSSSRRPLAGAQRTALGPSRGCPSHGLERAGRVAAARMGHQGRRCSTIARPRIFAKPALERRQRAVAAAGARAQSWHRRAAARRVPDELDARRRLRFAARGARARRTDVAGSSKGRRRDRAGARGPPDWSRPAARGLRAASRSTRPALRGGEDGLARAAATIPC